MLSGPERRFQQPQGLLPALGQVQALDPLPAGTLDQIVQSREHHQRAIALVRNRGQVTEVAAPHARERGCLALRKHPDERRIAIRALQDRPSIRRAKLLRGLEIDRARDAADKEEERGRRRAFR